MKSVQSCKVEGIVQVGTSVATNATTIGYLDTLGWDQADIFVTYSTNATTSACATVLSLKEGTNSTASTSIVAFTGGTATSTSVGFVIPAFKGTAEPTVIHFSVDLQKRERYLRVTSTSPAAGTVSAIAVLSRGEVMPGADAGSVAIKVVG